jgi:hypothetical protein
MDSEECSATGNLGRCPKLFLWCRHTEAKASSQATMVWSKYHVQHTHPLVHGLAHTGLEGHNGHRHGRSLTGYRDRNKYSPGQGGNLFGYKSGIRFNIVA